MKEPPLQILGLGTFTDQFADAAALAEAVFQACRPRPTPADFPLAGEKAPSLSDKRFAWIGRALPANPQPNFDSPDPVVQYAFAAIEQAWRAAGLEQSPISRQRIGLILFSRWGAIDSTAAYLESMFDADGRYASPLRFTRSVYSSVASLAAIHFHIHGPCETLAHDAWIATGVLERADDLLSNAHLDAVLVCWADQSSPLGIDLCDRAVRRLKRRELARYTRGDCGYGAVAMALTKPSLHQRVQPSAASIAPQLEVPAESALPARGRAPTAALATHPFPSDPSLRLAAAIIEAAISAHADEPILWWEPAHHGRRRSVRIG